MKVEQVVEDRLGQSPRKSGFIVFPEDFSHPSSRLSGKTLCFIRKRDGERALLGAHPLPPQTCRLLEKRCGGRVRKDDDRPLQKQISARLRSVIQETAS